jgi:hypothetical protein
MKTKLIALVALAMAEFAFLSADVAEGSEFEVEASDAEGLLTEGKAKLADASPTSASRAKPVKARVLTSCAYGQPNDVVELPADQAKAAEAEGLLDTNKAAVAYATRLKQTDA